MSDTMTDKSYSEILAEFDAREHDAQSHAGDVSRLDDEHVRIALAVLKGELSEAKALDLVDALDQDRRRMRLYHPAAIRQVVDEIRAERDRYTRSPTGIAAKRADDQRRTQEFYESTEVFKQDQHNAAEAARRAERERAEKANRERYERDVRGREARERAAAEQAAYEERQRQAGLRG